MAHLSRAADADPAARPVPVVSLSAITIESSRLTPADSSTLKLPLPLHDTPRSVTVLDEARLREQDFQTLAETLAYVPGVFSFGNNGDSYHFFSRGFNMGADETKLDGFTGFISNGSFSPNLFGAEQVVFLRGPAGLLYGAAATPGGMINLVTKKPQRTPFTRVGIRYATSAGGGAALGSHAGTEVEIDLNQRLTADGRLGYRFAAEAEERTFFTDGIHDRTRAALFALTWKFGRDDRFELTPLFHYERQPFTEGRGLVISPSTSLSAADGRDGPIRTADLTPLTNSLSGGGRHNEHHIAGLDFRATLTPAWRATLAYRFMATDSDVNQFSAQTATLRQLTTADPRSWVLDRRQTVSQTDRRNHAFDLGTTYESAPATSVKNLTQLGFNARSFRTTVSRAAATQSNQSPINSYTAVAPVGLIDRHPALINAFLNDDFYWNAYAQNQTAFGERWILTLGAGYGEQRFGRDYPVGQAPPANLAQLTATRRGDPTPNASLVFKPTPPLALYASYSTSYQPADGSLEDRSGQTGSFRPTTGRNFEFGAKFDFADRRGSLTASVFETALTNVLVQSDATQLNPNGNRYSTQTAGGRRTRGAEFSAEVQPLENWRVTATASVLDSRYRGEGRIPGSRTEKTPPLAISLLQRYDFARGPLKNFSASLGLVWQDDRLSVARTPAAPDPLVLPAFARCDAGLFYRVNPCWDFALNCQNLFDRLYFTNGATGAALEAGAPRSLALRVNRQF